MLIIIEGPDKTGKTTLAKAIATRLGFDYKHFSAPKGSPADEYIDFLLSLKRDTVCDRFHLGELVYGPMLRGKVGITPLELVTIERVLRLKQTVLIHAVTSMKIANERLAHSNEHEVVNVAENLLAEDRFTQVISKSNAGPIIKYDGSSMDNLYKIINDLAKIQRSLAGPAKYAGIGTITGAKLVFVGEQVNKNVTWRNLPFDKGLSSQFLLDTFITAGVPEKAVYICNANRLTRQEVANLMLAGRTTFITLGEKAANKLDSFDVPHLELAHPQYIKRFHFKRKDRYVAQFKEAVICA